MGTEETEYEKLQKLAEDGSTVPKFEGSLVGDVVSSYAIRDEYLNNETYREKAEKLPLQFAWLREIGRDGNCGWRAILFATFEILLSFGDFSKLTDLVARLDSMDKLLSKWYGDEMIYSDFKEETLEFLQTLQESISSPADGLRKLTTAFRDPLGSSSILFYFRMIVSAWIREHSDVYENFISLEVASSVADYCRTKIDVPATDIDEPGISALWDAVIKGMGIVIGIVNLDNNPGDTCHIITYSPPEPEGFPLPKLPTIWMLRRIIGSGHYDLLYKDEGSFSMKPQVLRASDVPYNEIGDVWPMEQLLGDASYNNYNNHRKGAVELLDPLYSRPYSTLNTSSMGRRSDLPYIAGPSKLEYAPYLDEEPDSIFERSVPFSLATQNHQSSKNVSELPERFPEEDPRELGPFRDAIMTCSDSCDEKCGKMCRKTRAEKIKDKFVASPDPQQGKATKRIKEDLESSQNFRNRNFTPIIEAEPSGYNKGKGKANAKPKGPAK